MDTRNWLTLAGITMEDVLRYCIEAEKLDTTMKSSELRQAAYVLRVNLEAALQK